MGDGSYELIAAVFLRDLFYMPLIIVAMSTFYFGLNSLVVTEAVVLVVLLFLLRRSFTDFDLNGSFSILFFVS